MFKRRSNQSAIKQERIQHHAVPGGPVLNGLKRRGKTRHLTFWIISHGNCHRARLLCVKCVPVPCQSRDQFRVDFRTCVPSRTQPRPSPMGKDREKTIPSGFEEMCVIYYLRWHQVPPMFWSRAFSAFCVIDPPAFCSKYLLPFLK